MCECIAVHGKTQHSVDCVDCPKGPRKHAAVIKAWADGAVVQTRLTALDASADWLDAGQPQWYEDYEYRVKPQAFKYKRYLYRRFGITVVGCHNYAARFKRPECRLEFIKWLDTDWQTVEV